MKVIMRIFGLLILILLIAVSGCWAILALINAGPYSEMVRNILAASFAVVLLAVLLAMFFRSWRSYAITGYIMLFAVVLVWWGSMEPSNERDWQTDVAVLPSATIDGDMVTLHNIRNSEYRSETDYTPHYYDKRVDLRELTGVDVIAVYWMGPAIAHVFLSFEFNHNDHIAISIETRKEKGEDYSSIKGFFRQYELFYVVADERDVIRLRTNYRQNPPEDVYIYRAKGELESGRRLFLEYVRRINALTTEPEFYNTLLTNCTTSIWMSTRVNQQHIPLDWKILVSGYLPQYLYEQGRLEANGLSFDELKQRSYANVRAHAADSAADFSQLIRK
ncbi:DUF4105 domain-containing protein [Tolumonas osonensis]|uniref:Lnb N-terminal periplasmic domain-containing protein n=1 Tax=Tolumonas osonensis TaxID=675874 RepID=A0A841GKT6_9GAMM|nr:DUF4105 domain-containing protein [Tolumonas osonensis]MBB6055112.1 hypothetical protein [Tolumonas osonensis]